MAGIIDITQYDIDAQALDLVNLMQATLTRLSEAYAQYGAPFPSRSYYMTGLPAYDCEQAVVSLTQTYLGLPGSQANVPIPCNGTTSAVITITIVRPTATQSSNGKPPDAATIQQAAQITLVDGGILMEVVNTFDSWYGDGLPGLGVIASADYQDPSGAFHAVALQFTVAVLQ